MADLITQMSQVTVRVDHLINLEHIDIGQEVAVIILGSLFLNKIHGMIKAWKKK